MARYGPRCRGCCIALLAVVLGPVYMEPGRRFPPLFAGNLNNHDVDFQEFALETLQTLDSKRIVGPVLAHEATENNWLEDGLVLDIGVFLGSSTRFLAGLLHNRTTVHGFDTFSGFPETGAWYIDDFQYPTEFRHSEFWVKWLVREQGLLFADGKPPTVGFNVDFHRGLTFDTLPRVLDENPGKAVKLMHVDIDTYEGALHALETCRKRMIPGTIIIFDDFFVLSGELKAFYDFQRNHSFEYTWTAWGHDIGFVNAVSFGSWLCFILGWNVIPTKLLQIFAGWRHSISWKDYAFAVFYGFNNAVSLRITDLGNLHDK